jgi:hypothetical protein
LKKKVLVAAAIMTVQRLQVYLGKGFISTLICGSIEGDVTVTSQTSRAWDRLLRKSGKVEQGWRRDTL